MELSQVSLVKLRDGNTALIVLGPEEMVDPARNITVEGLLRSEDVLAMEKATWLDEASQVGTSSLERICDLGRGISQ